MKNELYVILTALGRYLRSNKQQHIYIDVECIDDVIHYNVNCDGEGECTDIGELEL